MKPAILLQKPVGMQARPLQGGSFLWGAHHPHCEYHRHHLIWIRGHPLCLGCTSMYAGIALGVPVALVINWSLFTFASWASLHLALLVPTAIQFKVQAKPFKIVSRLVLGVCVTSYWSSGLFLFAPSLLNTWLFRFLIVASFAIVFRTLFHLRNNFADDPCADCALGAYPICEWNLPRLLNENDDADIVQALQNSRFSSSNF